MADHEIVFDIETIPCQQAGLTTAMLARHHEEVERELESVRAPANYKDEAKIAEHVAAKREEISAASRQRFAEKHAATGLDAAYGEIVVIGYAVGDDEPVTLVRKDGDRWTADSERELIRRFYAGLDGLTGHGRKRLIGHNLIGFDLRFLWQRSMVLGVRPPSWLPRDPKPWSDEVFDTMLGWAGARDRISLDKLCQALGVPSPKGGMTGAEVWPAVQAGRLQEVADYCSRDVSATRAVFRRMNFRGE